MSVCKDRLQTGIFWVSFFYNVSVSFHSGLSDALMVFVFILTLSLSVVGMSRALTKGSDRPLGSMGIKFLPWHTANDINTSDFVIEEKRRR